MAWVSVNKFMQSKKYTFKLRFYSESSPSHCLRLLVKKSALEFSPKYVFGIQSICISHQHTSQSKASASEQIPREI